MTRQVGQVRSFNRTVTQSIGALEEEYLARARPLGASRVLWEVSADGTDVRELRARLGLDSGYLSRLLRRLEGEGLVTVAADPADRRVRVARLTAAGRVERAELDRVSDDLAASLLSPLAEVERARLVEAMATVERLLTAGAVDVRIEDPTGEGARSCLEAYARELAVRFEDGFYDPADLSADAAGLAPPSGLVLVARRHGEPVGCVALRFDGAGPAEIIRLWVDTRARGLGLGRRLLREAEGQARAHGARVVRLDTNRTLTEAIALYRGSGYVEIPRFNDERYAHHWFEKHLTP